MNENILLCKFYVKKGKKARIFIKKEMELINR